MLEIASYSHNYKFLQALYLCIYMFRPFEHFLIKVKKNKKLVKMM